MFYVIPALYGFVLTLLFIRGMNIFYTTYLALKLRRPDSTPPPLDEYPLVTVQLPIYNERYVARRVIEAACQLDWPRDRLEIQVLDDSTDDTVAMVAATVRHLQGQGFNIVHLHRDDRTGFKAGALAAGLDAAHGDYIAIFDADFAPPPDFLRQTMPHFAAADVAFVQTRWGHLNRDYSLLTQLQALAIDAHFRVEQYARYRAGFLLNFNGTAGVWRRAAIDDAGGWRADTLTEDLDLSYRALLKGWKPVYLRDVVTPGEIPVTLNGYRRQQYRWARGSIECALRLIPRLFREPLPNYVRFQGVLHLTGYSVQFLMMLVVLLYPAMIVTVDHHPELRRIFKLAAVYSPGFVAPSLYFLFGQGRGWWRRWRQILLLNVLGAGMIYHNTFAVMAAIFARKGGTFERTPKFGITDHGSWSGKSYYIKVSPVVLVEMLMVVFNLNTVRLALANGNWSIALYASILTLGLLFILGLIAWQALKNLGWRLGTVTETP